MIIGRLPGTPPGRHKRSQNLPRELPRTLRPLRRLSRTPRTPWESRNLWKISKKQRKSYKTYKNHRKSNGIKGNLQKHQRWPVPFTCNRSPTNKKIGGRVPCKWKSNRSYVTWIYHQPVRFASSQDTNTQTYMNTSNNHARSQRLSNLLVLSGVGGRT